MKKEIFQEIEIPEGVEAEIVENTITARGPEGENQKKLNFSNKINIEKKGNKILVGCKKATKTEKRLINTITAHIKNLLQGVKEKFEYKLKICFSHFPITVDIKGEELIIKNFLGEKTPRKLKIPERVDIKIDKEIITILSVDKETAGQAAANLEKTTKITGKDRRVFQDGIFIISKSGKEIW